MSGAMIQRYNRLFEKTLEEVEREARDYFYKSKNAKKARQSKKMDKLQKEWEALSKDKNIDYTFGDVLA